MYTRIFSHFSWNIYFGVVGEKSRLSSQNCPLLRSVNSPLVSSRTSPRFDDDSELERGAMHGPVVRW